MSTDQGTQEWLEELDYWRGIAFLGVAFQHVLGIFCDQQIGFDLPLAVTLGLAFNLVKFAVPAFILVSGLVLVRKYLVKLQTLSFYRKRARELLVPYLLWTLIYQLYYTWGTGHPSLDLHTWAYQSLTGTGAYHLWYVVLVLQFYLLFPVFLPIFRWLERQRRLLMPLLGFGLIYLLFMWLSYSYLPAHGDSFSGSIGHLFVKYRDRNLVFWFFYFIAGGMIALHLKEFYGLLGRYRSYNWILWCFLLVWVTKELAAGINNHTVNLSISTTLKPSMFFFTMSSLLLLYDLCMHLSSRPGWLPGLLKTFGRYSQGAYFIHALTLAAAMYPLRSYGLPDTSPYLSMALAWAICTLLALLLTFILSRIPGGRWLIGTVPGNKKSADPDAKGGRPIRPASL